MNDFTFTPDDSDGNRDDSNSTDIRPTPVDELPFQRKHIGPTIIEEPDGALTLKIESETRNKLHSIAESISPKLTSLFSSLVTPTEPPQPQLSDEPPSEETEWNEINPEEIQSEFGEFEDNTTNTTDEPIFDNFEDDGNEELTTEPYGNPVSVNTGYTVSIPKTLLEETGLSEYDRVKKVMDGGSVLFTAPSHEHEGEHMSFIKPLSSMSVSNKVFDVGDTVERIPHEEHIEIRRSEQV